MLQQITVKLSDQVTAIITYHFPLPAKCTPVAYSGEFEIQENGTIITVKSKHEAAQYFQNLHKQNILVPAKISNVIFLQSEYKRKALQLYSYELAEIQKSLDAIPGMQFDTPAALQDYCTVYDY